MLEHIFGSRTRVKLLNLFVHHSDEQFYVRELTRRIQTQINAVRREIQNLLKLGLIKEGTSPDKTEEHRKQPGMKRKYFTTNTDFPLFHEIRALLLKSQVFIERQLDRQILKTGDIRYLAFLGAFLGLRNQPVDVFIVGTVDERALRRVMEDAGTHMELDINYSCLTPQEFKYRREIADRFVTAILLAPKTVIVNTLEEKDLAR